MAFQNVIPVQTRAPGIYRSAAHSLPPGTKRVSVRLASSWATGDIVLFGFEQSLDGGVTWKHAATSVTYAGMLDMQGQMPMVSIINPDTSRQFRLLAMLSQSIDLGADLEVA